MPRPAKASLRAAAAPAATASRPASRNGRIPVRAPRGRVRRIVTVGDRAAAVLRRRSRPVGRLDASIRRLVADMAVTMRYAQGVGLAAPQIGVPLRVLVADTGRGLLALVNPRLLRRSGAQVAVEGCLSIPGVVAPVRRALHVTVDGTLVTGQRVGLRATGYVARILQHEIDHLNGVLFLDRVRRSAIHRRPLRPGERRRGAKSAAAAVLRTAAKSGRRRGHPPTRTRAVPRPGPAGRPSRHPEDPRAGSTLVVASTPRPRPAPSRESGTGRRYATASPVTARP